MDQFFPPEEELDEELKRYLAPVAKLGQVLQHPLVYAIPYVPRMSGYYNQMLRRKTAAVLAFIEKGNWGGILSIYERPHRLQAFLLIESGMDDATYWDLLTWMWSDSENIWQNKAEWVEVLSAKRPLSKFGSEEDWRVFSKLPEHFEVHRGYIKGKNYNGLSYSLDYDKAARFASRYLYSNETPAVRTRWVLKRDVFAYTNIRDEQEIIILPGSSRKKKL